VLESAGRLGFLKLVRPGVDCADSLSGGSGRSSSCFLGPWSDFALGTGLSPAELKRAAPAGTTSGCRVVYMASSKTLPELALATAHTAKAFPFT